MADPLDTWVGFASATPLPDSRTAREMGTEVLAPSARQVWGASIGQDIAGLPTPRLVEQGLIGVEEAGTTAPFEPDAPYLAFDQPAPTTPTLSGDEANAKYGIPGVLNFNLPISEARARSLNQQKRAAAERDDILRRNEGGVVGGLVRGSVGLAIGALDPMNVAAAFVPLPGVGVLGARVLTAAGESALARFGARAITGGITGAVGTAAFQPIEYGLSRAEWNDYTMSQALANIAFGTVLGGGLHAAGGYIGDRLRNPFAQRLEQAGPEVREDALKGAVVQVAEGRDVNVAPLIEYEIAARTEAALAREARRQAPTAETIPIHRVFTGEGPAPGEGGKPQGMYVSIAEHPEFESPHAGEAKAAQSGYLEPKNPLEVPEISVDHARGGGLTIPASAGVSALKLLSTPEEFAALLKMTKAQVIEQIRKEFPNVNLDRQVAGRDHDAYEMLEILGAQRARAAGHDALILRDQNNPNFSEAVVLDPSAARFGQSTTENIARFDQNKAPPTAAAARQDTLRVANDVVTAARADPVPRGDPTAEVEAQRVTERVPATTDEAAAQKLLADTEAELQTLREPGAEGEAAKFPADVEAALKASEETFKADEGFAKAFVEAGACLAELGIPR